MRTSQSNANNPPKPPATDKRLMMFQQDESNALAASSQQTNSALSAHVIRLSRGRAYAALVGLFIVATWFQLIAQLQTLVSLFLLAIIGLLLGQRNSGRSQQQKRRRSAHDDDHDDDAAAHEKRPIGPKQHCQLLESSGPAVGLGARDELQLETTNMGSDRLLRGAEEALSLLRTLGAEEDEQALSCSSSLELADEDDPTAFRSLSFGALDRFTTPDQRRRRPPATSQPTALTIDRPALMSRGHLEGPDGELGPKAAAQPSPNSSSSSPNSTGYNSDSTRRCSSSAGGNCVLTTPTVGGPARGTPNVSLLDGGRAEGETELTPEPAVIELIKGQPTAMKLIIEHLQRTGELAPSWTSSMDRDSCGRRRRQRDEQLHSSLPSRPTDEVGRPLDLSRAELAKQTASATFQRPD